MTTRGGGNKSYEVIWAVNDNVTFHYVEDLSQERHVVYAGAQHVTTSSMHSDGR